MEYNYDRNTSRHRVNNQSAATPYSRPQESRYMSSLGRPMVSTQDRHSREHISDRYGNVLDDIPQQAGLPGMPQTPARSTFARPRFQTPFAPGVARSDSPQMCVVPRAPYSSGGDLDDMMMPIGSPATPHPRYTDYDTMGHFNTPAPRFARRHVDHVVYDHYAEMNETPLNSETHDFNNMPVLKSAPQEFSAPFNNNRSPQVYGSFLRGALHQLPSPMMRNQYEEPVEMVNAYKKSNPLASNTRQYLNEPMEETVEDASFAKLSLDKDSQEGTSRQLGGARKPAVPQKVVATPGPVLMSKKAPEPAPAAQKDAGVKNLVMSGPIEKVLKWDALLHANPMILYETIGPLVQVRQGERADEKILLLRDVSTPVLQCVFSEVDRCLPYLRPGQLVRCVGKMVSSAKMRGFSVRPATDAEKKCLLRMSFIINRVVNDLTKVKKPDSSEPPAL